MIVLSGKAYSTSLNNLVYEAAAVLVSGSDSAYF